MDPPRRCIPRAGEVEAMRPDAGIITAVVAATGRLDVVSWAASTPLILALLISAAVSWGAEDAPPPSGVPLSGQRDRVFDQLDTNRDRRLSVEEYVGDHPQADLRRRDFKLFDFSGDSSLTRVEFAAIPGIGPPEQRGAIPDPYDGLLEQAVDAMDQSYDGWDQRQAEQMNSTFFAINFAASLATDNRRRLDREIVSQADPNGDHMVTRDEAKRFLEIQLGIRWVDGTRLRLGNGRVVNFARFLRSDANSDDVVSKSEFVTHWWRAETAEEDFNSLDRNGDDKLTLSEFARADGPNIVDPVLTFRKADTDLDALLDADELTAATPDYRANLISSTLRGFDGNQDGKISLNEYLLSMLGNYNYPWNSLPRDDNNDQRLSFEEFVFFGDRSLFQLQRRYFFHRLDVDADQRLSGGEFEFKLKSVNSLTRYDIGSGEAVVLFRQREFPSCGSPSVSADGKWILFDAASIEGISKTRVMKMTADGQDVQDLCDGLMPSWSPDGSQFACSRYTGGSGVWIVAADGGAKKRVSDGWAAQWSPDGKSIAFTRNNSLCVYDVQSEEIRVVLEKNAHPYQYIFWNMSWSPDSKQMVFKGRLTNKQEIAIVNMTGKPDLERMFASEKHLAPDLAWSPDGRRILFSMHSPKTNKNQIHQLAPGSDQPELLPGLSDDQSWGSVGFSPDGKWLVLSSTD